MAYIVLIVALFLGVKLLIKIGPFLLRILLYCAVGAAILGFLVFLIPGPLDEVALLVYLGFLGLRALGSSMGIGGYVLNRKSGVIHDSWDSSVETISEKNRRSISYSEAQDLVDRGTKYRFRK